MRSIYLKALVVGLVAMGWLGTLAEANAQYTNLFSWEKVWKYNTNGTDLATAWRGTNYPAESSWPSGQGVLGYPSNEGLAGTPGAAINTTLTLSNATTRIRTFYFRTTFNFPTTTNNMVLVASNLIDDGVIYYLNGVELSNALTTTRLGMNQGAVDWTTEASRADDISDHGLEVWSIQPTNLVQGQNVLAAEVHQRGATSSDVVFGLNLGFRRASPPIIVTNLPTSLAVELGSNVNLRVSVSGDGPFGYRWFRNGTNFPGAPNNATYNIPFAHPTNQTMYYVTVTNAFGTTNSFFCNLSVYVNSIVITNQLDSITNEPGQAASFDIGVRGSMPSYQWYTNGVKISGATSATYAVPSTQLSALGLWRYTCVISNTAYSGNPAVTSQVAFLSIVKDTTGPALISAEAQTNLPPNIVVTFTEKLHGFYATNGWTTNYVIRQVGSANTLAVTNARANGAVVTLNVTPKWIDGASYYLEVNNVRDQKTNTIAPHSKIGLSFSEVEEVLPMNQLWYVWPDGDITPYCGDAWKTNLFLPPVPYRGWGNALLAFEYGVLTNTCGGEKNYDLSYPFLTTYFTTTFNMPTVNPRAKFEMHNVLDDGAVFYLNGKDIGRNNMPGSTIAYSTLSTASVGDAVCYTNTFSVSNLVSGQNILSAEVHQSSADSTDIVFGAKLIATISTVYELDPVPSPRLNMVRQGNQITFSWTGDGYALEYKDNVTDRWVEAQPDMANPYRTSITNAVRRFWQLRNKQP